MPTKAKVGISTQKSIQRQRIFTMPIIICALACVFCMVMIVVCLLNPGTKSISVTSPVEKLEPLEAVKPQERLVQQFTSDGDYTRFGLYYANYSNYIQGGELHVDITNSTGEVSEYTYDIGGVIDNSFIYIDYSLEANETYTLAIYLTGNAQGITFFTTAADDNYHAELLRSEQPQERTIIMSFVTEDEDRFMVWYYIMAVALILCYVVLKIDRGIYVKKA